MVNELTLESNLDKDRIHMCREEAPMSDTAQYEDVYLFQIDTPTEHTKYMVTVNNIDIPELLDSGSSLNIIDDNT